MLRIPDSGEKNSYATTFGDDADYSINPIHLKDNGDGTITDSITGLMWQKKDGGEMTIESAANYCDTLTLAGYTNWRLPNAHESFSILNLQNTNPAIDTSFFTKTTADYWWTSNRQLGDSTKVWCTNAGGGVGNKPKTESISAGGAFRYHTRAVRNDNEPILVSSHFTYNGNGTTTDNFTGFMWQRVPYTDTLTWENALGYADTLTLAGYTDWRMPNVREMQSINDESRTNPSLDTNYFKVIANKKYWSSTTLVNQTARAWYLNSRYGVTTYDLKTARDYIFCVRGKGIDGINYVFIGNGNWSDALNWLNNTLPPSVLPAGSVITINPVQGGVCLLDVTQQIAKGACITVKSAKSFVVPGNFLIQQ
jgi:hypothetical protein